MKYFKVQIVDAVLLKKDMHDAPEWFRNAISQGKITLCHDTFGNIIEEIICVKMCYGDILCPFGSYLVRDSYGNFECVKGSVFEKDYEPIDDCSEGEFAE